MSDINFQHRVPLFLLGVVGGGGGGGGGEGVLSCTKF